MAALPNLESEGGSEHRSSPRTNTMLSATVETGAVALPVRIRNLSETGALIEGSGLPAAGARLVLKRGELQIGATVAWAGGYRRGIRFDGPTSVQDWTGGKPRPIDCTGLRDQRRVDAIQAAVRGGLSLVGATPAPASEPAEVAALHLDSRLAEELAYVQRLLESMGDQLIADPLIVQRHARTLQSFDLANQILGHVAAIIVAEDRPAAVEKIGMDDLRARLKRKPLLRT